MGSELAGAQQNETGAIELSAPAVERYGVPAFLWLPMDGAPIGIHGEMEAWADTDGDGGMLGGRVFAPLAQDQRSTLMLDLGGYTHFNDGFDETSWHGLAGIVWRQGLAQNALIGVNAYVDAVKPWDSEETMFLGGLGAEFEHRFAPGIGSAFLQLGANVYLPFADYTDDANFGELTEVPRFGVDVFASIGKAIAGFGLRGTASAFSYEATDRAEALNGYALQGDIEWRRGLPDNATLIGTIGLREDDGISSDTEAFVGLKLSVLIGGPSRSGGIDRARGAGLTPVTIEPARRHLGFGSPLTPAQEVSPCPPGLLSDPDTNVCLIDGVAEPPCPPGFDLDPATNQCVTPEGVGICPPSGFNLDPTINQCIRLDDGEPCPPGLEVDAQTNQCVRDGSANPCPPGFELDTTTNQCVSIEDGSPLVPDDLLP